MNIPWRMLTDPQAARLALALLHLVWQGALVAAVLAIALRLLRNRSANARYLASLVAMAAIAAAPIVTFLAVDAPSRDTATATPVTIAPSPVAMPTMPAVVPGRPAPAATAPDSSATIELPPVPPVARPEAPALDWSRRALDAVEPYLPHVVAAWTVGVLLIGLWRLGGWMQVRRLTRLSAAAVPTHLEAAMRRLAARLGVARPVRLLKSALATVPTVIGWWRPVVLLPVAALTGLTPEQIEVVLAHELAHIRRHDYLVNLAQVVVETLLFYHPAVWWVSSRIRDEREHCCDDLALTVSSNRAAYARALERIARLHRGPALALSARGGSLLARIRRILGLRDVERFSPASWLAAALVLVIVGLVFYGCAVARVQDDTAGPRFTDVEMRLGTRPGALSNSTGPFGRTGKLIFGHPGQVSEVTWKYLRTTDEGDVYEMTRRYPSDTDRPEITMITVTYNGVPTVAFEDDVHRAILFPAGAFDALVAELHRSTPRRPRWLVAAEVAEFGGAEAVRHLRDTLKELTPEELASAPSTPERIVEVIRKLEPAGFPTALCSFANFHAVGDRGWTLLEGMDLDRMVSTYVQPFERRQTEQQTREAAYGALAAKDGLDLAWEEEGGNRLLAFGGLKLAPFKLPALPQGYDVWSDGERFLDQRRLVRMVESYNATANVPEVRQGVRAYPFAPGDRFLALLPGDRVGLVRCGEVFHNAQYVYLHFTAKLFDPLYQTVPASAFPDILGDADKATAGSDGVAVEYQMTSTIPVPDAGVTAVSTSATGSLNTGWTAPPKGELEFESFSLQVDGNHRDAQGRPQGMLLDKAGKAIGVYLVVKGDTMRCVREAARDRRHGDRPVALLLPDADRDTVEQAWSVLREFCGDRAVLLVPGKLPSDVRLLAHAEHAAGDPQKSLAATDAFPDSDLRGRWECERDGVKATIELYSDGQATWRIEMRQYTIVSSLALVDEPQTGTIALRADYTVGATRENKSTVIGRLERTPSGELAASVLPAAKELNSSYRVVSQIPLRRTGPATWRKEAAVTDLRPSGAEPGQGSWRIAPVQPVELRLHEFSVDELSGAASWGGDYLRRKIAEPVDLMGTVEVNSDRLLWHSSLARTDQPQPKLEFCDADYPGSGIGTPTIGVSSAPRLLTPQCRVLWAVQWRDSAGRLLKTAGCLARVTEPRPDDEAPPGPTDEEIREALRLWADDGRNSPEAVARQRFLAVERFARLPADEQAEQLPQFYRDVAPGSINRVFESILSSVPTNILDRDPARGFAGNTMAWARQLADASAELTPEQVADKLDNILWLRIATRARAVQVLMKHVARTETLIREDLASREAARVDRGCGAFDALQLPALVEPLLEMFLADDALSEAAGRALLWVDDPAVCARLMERVDKDASFLARCAGKLQGGLYRKPAGPVLLRLLESADAEVRYNAGRAVYECTDPNLVGPAAKFARDAEPRFRVMAAYLGSNLPAASFASARADLLPLLSDPDEEVRLQGLRCFAQQKDLAAGPTILDFLRGSHTGPAGQREVTVMQSLAALTGEQFGYDMHHWGADAPGNQEAIRRFEAWLSAAKAKASGGEVEVLPAEVKPEASLSVQLVNPQGQALEKQSLVMVPVSTGYSEAIEKSFFWADKSGKVIVKELAPGKHRFVVNAQWPHPTFAEFDAPEEGGETRLTVRPRSDDALPDLDVKVQQRTEDDKILLDVTVTNNTDAAYTLTDTDLQLVSIRHRVFPPLPQQPAAVIVPPRGKGESKFTLDWNRYVKLGQWCSRNGEDISWPGPTEDDQHMYYRVQVGITGSLPIPMPKPGEKRAGGPALQFRIAPSPTDLDEAELASCRDWLKAGRVGFWWKDGRAAGMAGDAGMGGRMPRHAWLPIAGDVRDTPQLVTGEHDGQKYLLVSDRPGETMSSAAQGPDAWRLTRVAAETGEAGRPRVRFDLDDRGAALMSALTQVNLNRAMAVIVEGNVVAAPIVRARLGDCAVIYGLRDQQHANDVVRGLQPLVSTSGKQAAAGVWPPLLDSKALVGAWLRERTKNENGAGDPDYELMILHPDGPWAQVSLWGKPEKPSRIRIDSQGPAWECYQHPEGSPAPKLIRWTDADHTKSVGYDEHVAALEPGRVVFAAWAVNMLRSWEYRRCDPSQWQNLTTALARTAAPRLDPYPPQENVTWPGPLNPSRLVGTWFQRRENEPSPFLILRADRFWAEGSLSGTPNDPTGVVVHRSGRRWDLRRNGAPWSDTVLAFDDSAVPRSIASLDPSHLNFDTDPILRGVLVSSYDRCDATAATSIERAAAAAGPWALGVAAGTEDDAAKRRIRELVYVLRHSAGFSRVDEWSAAMKELAEIGRPAVPDLAAELDRTSNDGTMRQIGFVLRVIRDPRAVPALIRALPRTALASSDFGAGNWRTLFGNEDVHNFMLDHQLESPRGPDFTWNRAVTQITYALEGITGHQEGHAALSAVPRSDDPDEVRRVKAIRSQEAQQWQQWWDAHHAELATADELASLGTASTDEQIERAGIARFGPVFPTGAAVHLGPIVESVMYNQGLGDDKPPCLDFDTGKMYQFPKGLPETTPWLNENGIDAFAIRTNNGSYTVYGQDTHAWRVDAGLWNNLEEQLRGGRLALPSTVHGEFGWSAIWGGYPVTFLFTTRAGGRGIVQFVGENEEPPALRIRYRMVVDDGWPAGDGTEDRDETNAGDTSAASEKNDDALAELSGLPVRGYDLPPLLPEYPAPPLASRMDGSQRRDVSQLAQAAARLKALKQIEDRARSGEPWQSQGGRAAVRFLEGKGARIELRQAADGRWSVDRAGRTAPRAGNDAQHFSTKGDARIEVRQTPEGHEQVARLVDQMWTDHLNRDQRMVSVESRFILTDGDDAAAVDRWLAANAPDKVAETPAPDASHDSRVLDAGGAEAFLELVNARKSAVTTFAPRLTLWNGQLSYICDATMNVQEIARLDRPGRPRELVRLDRCGLLQVRPTVSDDPRSVRLDLHPRLVQDAEKEGPADPASPLLLVADLSASLNVPGGATVVLRVPVPVQRLLGVTDPPAEEAGEAAYDEGSPLKAVFGQAPQDGAKVLWLIVKPQVIAEDKAAADQAAPGDEAVEGRVVDPDGNPVAGAEVLLLELGPHYGNCEYPLEQKAHVRTVTGTTGTFSVPAAARPASAVFQTVVRKEGFGLGHKWNLGFPTADGKPHRIRLTRQSVLGGTVVDEQDRPIAGAEVLADLYFVKDTSSVDIQGGIRGLNWLTARTDDDGRFAFSNIPEGCWAEFVVRAPGRATVATVLDEPPLKYRAGQTDIRLVLPPEGRIEGVAVDKATGKPVADEQFVISSHDANERPGTLARTDGSGRFVFTGLAAGTWTIRGASSAIWQGAQTAEWVAAPCFVQVKSGGTASARIELEPGGLLDVTLTDAATGKPFRGVVMLIGGVREDQAGDDAPDNHRTDREKYVMVTGLDGTVRMRLMPGHYDVIATKSLERLSGEPQYGPESGQVEIDVKAGQTQRVSLRMQRLADAARSGSRRSAALGGRVTDPEGRPVAGATVHLLPWFTQPVAQTDADGAFTLPLGARRNDLTLVARSADGKLAAAVDVTADAETIDVRLAPALAISGLVLDEQGRPVAGAPLTFIPISAALRIPVSYAESVTGEDGRFDVGALPADHDYRLTINHGGPGECVVALGIARTSVRQVDARDGRIDAGTVTLPAADRSVAGVVVDAHGQPVPGVTVWSSGNSTLDAADGQPFRKAAADEAGRFRVENVCPGGLDLWVDDKDAGLSGRTSARVDREAKDPDDVRIVVNVRTSSPRVVRLDDVRITLHPTQPKWQPGETPTFTAEIENTGQRRLAAVVGPQPQGGHLQVDGRWYPVTFGDGDMVTGVTLEPGSTVKDVPVHPSPAFTRFAILQPGVRKLRLGMLIQDPQMPPPYSVTVAEGELVEIEIPPQDEGSGNDARDGGKTGDAAQPGAKTEVGTGQGLLELRLVAEDTGRPIAGTRIVVWLEILSLADKAAAFPVDTMAQMTTHGLARVIRRAAETDGSGLASFRLPAGQYVLNSADASGDEKYGRRRIDRNVAIVEGQTERLEVELARPPETPPVAIVVSDPDGRPAAGVKVSLMAAGKSAEATTDAAGRAELPVPSPLRKDRPEEVIVWARVADSNLAGLAKLGEPAVPLSVQLAPGLVLDGTVVDLEGRPVAEAVVRVSIEKPRGGAIGEARTRTDAQGRYEIRQGLPVGQRYFLHVNVIDNWSSSPGTGPTGRFGGAVVSLGQRKPGESHIEVDKVVLEPADCSVSGIVVDADGKPVPGVDVCVSSHWPPAAAVEAVQPRRLVSTDQQGRFRLEGLCKGSVHLRGLWSGLGALASKAPPAGGAMSSVKLTLTGDAEDVRMILRPAEEVFPAMKPRPADQPGQADPPAPPPAPANAATPPVQTRTVRDTRTEDVARQFLAAAEANDMEQAAQLSAGEFDGWLPAESVDALQLDERPFGWTSKYLKSAVGEMRHGVLSRCSAAYLVTHDLRVEGNVTGVWLGVAEKPLVLLVLKKTWAGWRMATFDEAWPDHGRQLAAHVERVNKVDAALAASWGEAVEGVQVRLWAEKTAWAQGDEPDLFLGVRNVGTEPFRTGVTHTGDCHQQVEVDGQWYGWAERMSPDVTPALITLEPGQMLPKLHGIGLHAGYGWALPKAGGRPPWAPGDDSAWGRRLMLAPGKHTIRVLCKAEGKTEPAVSNAVEIEVLPLEDRPPAAGSLEQMSREVLRQRLQRWARNPQHGRPDERMADPDNVDQVLAETGASADVLLRRVATARLLEWADRERVRARLIELAQDEDSLVKLHATSVLACLGDKQNALFLRVIASGMQTLTSSEFERNDAAWTLLAMGNKLPVAANDHSRFFDSILEQVRAAHVADREVGPEVLAVLAAQLQPGPAPEGTTAAEPRAGAATESAKSAADAPADGLAWGEPVDGIRCAVRPLQPAYAADEDILLEVRYQNVSEQPVTVCVRPDPFNDWTRLEVLNARGVADARGMHGQGVGPRLKASHLVTLAPGQTTSLRHDLPRTQMGKVMLEPGRYHARVTINVINGMWDHLPGLAELAAEQGVTLWKGIVASGLAPLTIVAAPDEPWGEASKGTQAHPRKELPGRVLAADGRPVAGAEVRYYGNRTATTDADGSFVLEVPDTQSAWTIDVLVPMWVRPYGMLLDPARGYPAALEIRLPPTRALRGQLVDDQGRPVTQASISAGTHSHGDWISPPVRQWPDGRFDLAAPIDEDNPRDVIIGVEAPGLAPQVVVWTDEEAARADTQIVLDAGRPCGGVIVDARGEPVAGARIVSDYVGKSRFAKFERITDQAGRFDIEYFPSSLPVAVTVFSDDRIPRRGVMLTADKTDHRIVMLDRLAVRGRVTDARTGEAVEAFIAVPGRKSSGTGGDKWYWDNEEATTGSHGDYTVTFGEGSSMAVRIEAPGYVPCVSRTILPEESDVRIDLALESGRNVEGTVVDGDGKPLADALVMVATADAPLYLSNETRDPPGGATAATTGADGRFTLPPQAKPFLVVVQHETGYALVPGERVLPAGKIAVGAWARVEGDLILAGAPAAGEKILIQCWSTRPILNDRPFVRYSVQAETDAQGRFVAERVAADNVQICHWIQHRRGAWETHRHVKLQLAPGETARVNLGANGRTITGRLQLPEPLKGANYWPYANANILRSQEGAYVTFDVNDDGSFRVEGVPPGEAWLRVTAYEPQPNGQSFHGREVAALKLNLSIPETPADDPDKPLDLGQLKLESP